MRKIFSLFLFLAFGVATTAQQAHAQGYEPYGKVGKEDLELKSCDFEKDANAEVLFDRSTVNTHFFQDRHKRVKIFNERGMGQANVRIVYNSMATFYNIPIFITLSNFKAETINYVDGKINITPLDKKDVRIEKIDKYYSALVFAMPNVKPGSIIEYKYAFSGTNYNWYFQSNIPVRYSEISIEFPPNMAWHYIPHTTQPLIKDVGGPLDAVQDKVMTNVHSLNDEPFAGSPYDNMQHMEFIETDRSATSWNNIGARLMQYEDVGQQIGRSLSGEDEIITQAKSLKSVDDKVAFIFNKVRNEMKWNDLNEFYVIDGTSEAWDRKTGDAAEINFIVLHLLKKAGINAYPLFTSTTDHTKLNPFNPDITKLNKVEVYVPVDTTDADNPKFYVLDATNKYNAYNQIPRDDLNTFGICADKDNFSSKYIFMDDKQPVTQLVSLDAEISADGNMNGTAEITRFDYNKLTSLRKYKTDGEEKYKRYLCNDDNNLKLLSLQMGNMDVDTLPLTQDIKFNMALTGADGTYIYFNPNLFITPHKNPFLSDQRQSDIDFGYQDRISLSGRFKIPAGYKVDALPGSINMIMPDTSIVFKRTLNEQDGTITIRYTMIRKKSLFSQAGYAEFAMFYKKMYEMLNEQIVLKKS